MSRRNNHTRTPSVDRPNQAHKAGASLRPTPPSPEGTPHHMSEPMRLRYGQDKELEAQAKALAGGVGWHDSQPWIPPVKERIVYPPNKNRQTKIPLMFDFSAVMDAEKPRKTYYDCSGYSSGRPTKSWAPPIPDPEGHRLPDESVINEMTFDDKPW